jgi:hypothetical protein
MMIHPCIPCQWGDHEHHHRVVEAVPKGVMGGCECHCEGECVERARRNPPPEIIEDSNFPSQEDVAVLEFLRRASELGSGDG